MGFSTTAGDTDAGRGAKHESARKTDAAGDGFKRERMQYIQQLGASSADVGRVIKHERTLLLPLHRCGTNVSNMSAQNNRREGGFCSPFLKHEALEIQTRNDRPGRGATVTDATPASCEGSIV